MTTTENSIQHFVDSLEIGLDWHYFGDFNEFAGNNPQEIDTSYLDLSEDFTFFFVFEKTNKENVVIFNSLDAEKRGFLLGNNNVNRVYFTFYRNQENPVTYTFNEKLADKNCLIVSQINGELSFALYDFNQRTLISETFSFDEAAFEHSDEWFAGGNFPEYLGFSVGDLTGEIDHVLYFEGYINAVPQREIVRAFFTEITSTEDSRVLSEENIAGQNWVTAIQEETTGIEQVQDYTDGGEEVQTFEWVENTAAVNEGDPILIDTGEVIPANGPLVPEKKVLRNGVAPNAGTFITSQTLEFKENITINERPLFSQEEIPENVTIRSVSADVQENSVVIPEENEVFVEDGNYINQFGFNNVLFIGDNDEEDNIEYIVFEGKAGVDNVNLSGQFSASFGGFGLQEFDTENEDAYATLNGLFLSKAEYDIISDFFIRKDLFDSDDNLEFDILDDAERGTLAIDDNFDQLPTEGNSYYLNGQKLVEGTDYDIVYDEFIPDEEYENWQGAIMFTPGFDAASKKGEFDISTSKFPRGTTIAYLNGIRNVDFVEHAAVDRLNESYIFNQNTDLLLDEDLWNGD